MVSHAHGHSAGSRGPPQQGLTCAHGLNTGKERTTPPSAAGLGKSAELWRGQKFTVVSISPLSSQWERGRSSQWEQAKFSQWERGSATTELQPTIRIQLATRRRRAPHPPLS